MLLPWPAKSPSLEYLPSVWIQRRPWLSKARPSGELNMLSAFTLAEPAYASPCTVGLPAMT